MKLNTIDLSTKLKFPYNISPVFNLRELNNNINEFHLILLALRHVKLETVPSMSIEIRTPNKLLLTGKLMV